jgi:hypothetical protein
MSPWFAMVLALALQPWVLLGAGAATVVEAKLSSWASFLALVVYCLLASSSYLGDGGLRRGPARGQPGAAGQVPGLDRRPYRPGDHRRALGITPSRIASSARSARYSFGRHGCRRCSTVSWWRRIKILAIRQASSRRDSRSHEAVRVIRRKTNRRHMTGDHHGQAAGMATLLVRAVDGILGTHKIVYRRELRSVITTGAQIMDQLFTPTQAPVPEHSHPPAPIPGLA